MQDQQNTGHSEEEILFLEKQHVSRILDLTNSYRSTLCDAGFEDSVTCHRLDELLGPLSTYKSLLDQQDRLDASVVRDTQTKVTEYLIQTKAQLFSDLSSSGEGAPIVGSDHNSNTSLASIEGSQDFYDSLIAQVHSGQKSNWNHDDLFRDLDEIIKEQTDYTAQLSSTRLKDAFARFVENQSALYNSFAEITQKQNELVEHMSGVMQSTVAFAVSLQPQIAYLYKQTEQSQKLLEQNEEILQRSAQKIQDIEETQEETVARQIQTQIGIDKTRQDLGLGEQFGIGPRIVSDKAQSNIHTSKPANDGDMDDPGHSPV